MITYTSLCLHAPAGKQSFNDFSFHWCDGPFIFSFRNIFSLNAVIINYFDKILLNVAFYRCSLLVWMKRAQNSFAGTPLITPTLPQSSCGSRTPRGCIRTCWRPAATICACGGWVNPPEEETNHDTNCVPYWAHFHSRPGVLKRVIFLSGCLALAIAWRLRHRIKSEHLTCFFNRSNVTKYEDYRSRIIMVVAVLIALLKTEMVIVFESYRM